MKLVKLGLIIVVSFCVVFFNIGTKKITYSVKDTYEIEVKSSKDIVYDGKTLEELIEIINLSLNSDISNKGKIIVNKCLEEGVDPYLAVAIILLETGCKWECSTLVKQCNNVGGQVGKPGCNGGSYATFSSLDEGINKFIENLANNYYAYGLNTPELMNKKYATSTTWASKVNNYINEIKSKNVLIKKING